MLYDTTTITVKVTDEKGNKVSKGHIILKLNGKTVRDFNGNIIYTTVENGTADIKFTLSDTFKTKTYTLTALYLDKSYSRAENTTQTTVTKNNRYC